MSETSTNLWPGIEGSGFDDPELAGDEAPDAPPDWLDGAENDARGGYSIRGHCGNDLARQIALADRHLSKASAGLTAARLQADNLQRQADELSHRADELQTKAARAAAWHESIVRTWALDRHTTDVLGKTITLAPAVVEVRETRGTTKVNDDALIALAQREDELWGTVVLKVPHVDLKAARERFEVRNGSVVDTHTGQIIEPLVYTDRKGEQHVGPIITQIELPGPRAKIKYVGAPVAPITQEGE